MDRGDVRRAVAAWLITREGIDRTAVRTALGWYLVQLVLNLGWTAVFFGLERPGLALAEITLLVLAIAITIWRFWVVSRTAAWLMVPYLAWSIYAGRSQQRSPASTEAPIMS